MNLKDALKEIKIGYKKILHFSAAEEVTWSWL